LETKIILKLIAPLLLLMISSCYNVNKNEVVKPGHFFNEEKMINVLTDIQIAEGTLSYERTKRIDIKDLKAAYYNQVFLKYGITAVDFKQNMDYYNSSPERIEKVLEKVLENINQMQGDLERKIADSLRVIRVQDSIRKADSIVLIIRNDSLRLLDSLNAHD